MKTLNIDSAAQTLTVGPGNIKIGDVLGPILQAGFEMRELPGKDENFDQEVLVQ
jgi:hypothetical protein